MIARARDGLRAWHATWASPPPPAIAAPPPRRPWPLHAFVTGVNVPWVRYGGDFGANAWRPAGGVGEATARAQLRPLLQRLADDGAAAVRWFLLCDGRAGVRQDSAGRVSGLDAFVRRDLDAAFDALALAGLRAIFVLLDYLWFAPPRERDRVVLGGRRRAAADPSECDRLCDTVVRPIVEAAGKDAPVLAWDLLNEPEWVTTGFGGSRRAGAVGRRVMVRFLAQLAASVHAASPHPVTVGLASARGLDLVRDLELDVYQVHWYDAVEPLAPLAMPVTEWRVDRPILLGEYPTRGSALAPDAIVAVARQSGYAGALGWSALTRDRASAGGG